MENKLKITALAIICLFFLTVSVSASAEYKNSVIASDGFSEPSLISDGNERTYSESAADSSVTVSNADGISSLYIVFDRVPGEWILRDTETGKEVPCGKNGFLHEFADLESLFGYLPKSVKLEFASAVSIDEVYAFSEGELPEWVQRWNPPTENADMLLFSSHSDDEQLFFAGILPYYAVERGYNVQVVYLVNHYNTHERPHEQLDGLWAVGVTNYPVISEFPDLYSESFAQAVSVYSSSGYTFEDFSEYVTECMRRFRPLVVVSHDVNGEYSHGTHILCVEAIKSYLDNAENPEYFPESASEYGLWTPNKTYLHLYSENPITLDLDTPLESLGGMTAFEATQKGFSYHKSQHWTWFYEWIYGTAEKPITKASQIETYSPCHYGLYQTTVGADTVGGDFFENVKTYAVLAAEKAAEEERESLEEASRLEAESIAESERESASLAESASIAEAERESEQNGNTPEKAEIDKTTLALIFVLIVISGVAITAVIIKVSSDIERKKR